jgi:hypothetical protein
MVLEFLTPAGALLALVVLVPVAAYLAMSRRADRMRLDLRLPGLAARRRIVPLGALLCVAGLLGLSAAQPVLQHSTTRKVRADAEVLIAIDVTRSMLARTSLDAATRLERAKAAAAQIRATLDGVPVGLASLTNRVLPHLFPSADEDVFRTTLERAIGIERPPPGSNFLSAQQGAPNTATDLDSLSLVARQNFYSPSARRRLLVVLTDGESTPVSYPLVAERLREGGIETVFVQFWGKDEGVFTAGKPEPQYVPDPAARSLLQALAAATGGSVFDESDIGGASRALREAIGSGPTIAEGQHPDRTALAPYLAIVAFLPLSFLLWWRDR